MSEQSRLEGTKTFSEKMARTPPAYRPVVTFSAEELAAMQKQLMQWLTSGEAGKAKFKLWTLVRGMLHQQVRDKIASEVMSGRSGPNATLRAQKDFAEAGNAMLDIIDKVQIPADIKPEDIMEMLKKAQEPKEDE